MNKLNKLYQALEIKAKNKLRARIDLAVNQISQFKAENSASYGNFTFNVKQDDGASLNLKIKDVLDGLRKYWFENNLEEAISKEISEFMNANERMTSQLLELDRYLNNEE